MKKVNQKKAKIIYIELVYGQYGKKSLFVPVEAVDNLDINAIISSKKMDKQNGKMSIVKNCNNFSISINRDIINHDLESTLETSLDISGVNVHYTYNSVEKYNVKTEWYSGIVDELEFDFNLFQHINYKTFEKSGMKYRQLIIEVK